jgi:Zn-dependent protease with chaperone function
MVAALLLAHFIGAASLSWLANEVSLISWRKSRSAHWAERARLLWPVRVTAASCVFFLPAILYFWQEGFYPKIPHWWIGDLVAAYFGAMLGCFPSDREVFPQLDFRNWWHQALAGWGVRLGIWGLFVLSIFLMQAEWGWGMLTVAVPYLVIHFAIQWGLILKYLRLVKFLVPADDPLLKIVNSTAAGMNVSVDTVWQMEGVLANAVAFPTTRELVFTKRLLKICSEEEVTAICAHELAHLKEGKWVLIGRLVGSLAVFPLIFINPCTHSFGLPGLLLPYLGMFSIVRFSRWLSRRMEKRADTLALSEQAGEGVYARALEKLYRENQMPAVNRNDKQTHPHLFDRMVAAGITPDFPRPKKPNRMSAIGWIYVFTLVLSIVMWASNRAGQ